MISTEKILSHINWFLNVIPVGLFGMISAPIIYPIAELIELVLPKHNPLWWWLDDEINNPDQNEDWLIYCNNKPNNIISRYTWHAFRNTLWNFKSLIRPYIARIHCIFFAAEEWDACQDNIEPPGR